MLLNARLVLSLWCAFGITSLASGQDKVFTDPTAAGPDFAVQGEYAEDPKADGQSLAYAAQVIALGGANFDFVLYHGGLPGDGWKPGDSREKARGQTKDGVTTFTASDWTAAIKDGELTLTDADGKAIGRMKKVERKSPTLGADPPEGAVVLFDGTTAEHFHNGKIVQGDLLAATNCYSKQQFGDHSLHLEFRTPFMPYARGQGRGNSGVYVQSRYEIQVLDSFGLEGRANECGGVYSIAAPLVNMCFPPLSWQTFDYDFTAARYDDDGNKTENARLTVRHNGVLIHDDLELPRHTPGRRPEGPGPEALFLQDHGEPVVFRNIWVVEKD